MSATLVNGTSCEHIESFKEYCEKGPGKSGTPACGTVPSDENGENYLKGMRAYSGGDEYYDGCFKDNKLQTEICYKKGSDGEKIDEPCANCSDAKCEKVPLKNCVELKNDFKALSEDAKRRWIFQKDYNTYSDLKKQCDVANGKVDTVNKSAEQYKKYVDSVDSSMKTSRNLDIVQAGLSGASTIASGVSLGFSVSAIGTVGNAIDELSKCNDAISKLRNVYGEYKAELEADEEE